ncbi:MAG: glycosyltransferase [Candidatus Aenigmatarchaeota archaeon]
MINESSIEDYHGIVEDQKLEQLKEKASKFSDKHIVHINSTFTGGGVAEILTDLVTLTNNLGIETGWRILKGTPDFFQVTKKFHNALQGGEINLTDIKKDIYTEENKWNSKMNHLGEHDMVFIHDPQPLPFIEYNEEERNQQWIWRCHIDLSEPNNIIWDYLKNFIEKYDGSIFTADKYKKKLGIPQHTIMPSINPISVKNKELGKSTISKYLHKYNIERDKPVITQISRFDKWKDQLGVIDIYNKINKEEDCKLILMGDMAFDDPEAPEYYQKVVKKAGEDEDIHIITQRNDLLVNIFQRVSDVVLQKSIREGFGLTLSEAMWKETPVIGTDIGGIPLQIKDGETGYLVNTKDECAEKILKIIRDDELKKKLGENAKEHVRQNFLITRHAENYLDLMEKYLE